MTTRRDANTATPRLRTSEDCIVSEVEEDMTFFSSYSPAPPHTLHTYTTNKLTSDEPSATSESLDMTFTYTPPPHEMQDETESISESTSDIQLRIHSLRRQLQLREAEVERARKERESREKKRALLQEEERLRSNFEVMNSTLKELRTTASALPLSSQSSLPPNESEGGREGEDGEEEEGVELSSKPLPFSATFYIVTSPMFTLGESVPLVGAEQGIVRFVGYPHFKEGVWIGVELEQQRRYTMFIPVRKVARLNEERDAGEEEKKEREEEWREEGEMFQRDEEKEQGEKVDVLQKRTELPPDLLTFSATCDLFTAAMFNLGQQVLVAGERGIVRFVSHTHLKEGVWIGVEPVKQKEKYDGSINGQRHSNCSPWYAMFIPVGKVPLLNKKVEEEEREKAGEEEERERRNGGEKRRYFKEMKRRTPPFPPSSLSHPPPFPTPLLLHFQPHPPHLPPSPTSLLLHLHPLPK